ncbi:hypothetical protein ACQP2X_22985 [Actinoplanes sp. CA-131856]
MSGRLPRAGLSAVVVAGLAGVASWASIADHKVGWTVVAASFAAVAGAFSPALIDLVWRSSRSGASVAEAAAELADVALTRVRSSSLRARLHRPLPMRVRFRSAPGTGATRAAVTGDPGPDWPESPLTGHVGEIASTLRDLPWRQLVVVGEPGAGKTVLATMLVDQLLSPRLPGEPVPVLIEVSSWDPGAESVAELLERRLVEDFRVAGPVARKLATESRSSEGGVSSWWVMPVLDGLDEIDAASHVTAMAALERFAAGDRPLVVTCRSREFRRAEQRAGVLARAAVIRMEPLGGTEVIDFLDDPAPARRALWAPVFENIRRHPHGPLATALSTPLMVGLAKDTYTTGDPGQLVGLTSRAEVTAQLIDGYVASVHPHRAAGRWLASLAYLGYLDETRDLRWWRLPWDRLATSPGRLRRGTGAGAAAAVLLASAVITLVTGELAWQLGGVVLCMCGSGVFGGLFAHQFQPAPAKNEGTALFGIGCGAITGLFLDDLLAGMIAGLGCAVLAAMIPSRRTTRRAHGGPVRTLRVNHGLALAGSARYAAVAAVVHATAAALLGVASFAWVTAGVTVFALMSLAGGEARWLRFRIVHLTIALGHRPLLPLTLIGFLTDGTHPDRATLRINGNAWQFRHAEIQDHLLRHARLELSRRRAAAGDERAAKQLVRLLRSAGDVTELTTRADAGDGEAGRQLAGLLRDRGDLMELRRRAERRDLAASEELVRVLRDQERLARLHRSAGMSEVYVLHNDLMRARELRSRSDAEALRHLTDRGDLMAARELAFLLRQRGDEAELRERFTGGDRSAGRELARLLRGNGDLPGLRDLAGSGDPLVQRELAILLRERGDEEELTRRSTAGDRAAGRELARTRRSHDDLDGAVALLRSRLYAGDRFAGSELTDLLLERGDIDGAAEVLRARFDAGDRLAGRELSDLLRERGDVPAAIALLRHRMDAGDVTVAFELARLLRRHGDRVAAVEVLSREAETGGSSSRQELARVLREQGDADALRERADDPEARSQLSGLLRERGDVDALGDLAERGDLGARLELGKLLRSLGRVDDAVRVLREGAETGDPGTASELVDLLTEIRDEQALADLADEGVVEAGAALAFLLHRRGDLAGLRRRAARGDADARPALARLLRERGDRAELRDRAEAGDRYATSALVSLLREQDDLDEAVALLSRRADDGDPDAARVLTELLCEQGRTDEAIAMVRRRAEDGDRKAVRQLAALLKEHGDLEEGISLLRRRADDGDQAAGRELARLLLEQGRTHELVYRAALGDRAAGAAMTSLMPRMMPGADAVPAPAEAE